MNRTSLNNLRPRARKRELSAEEERDRKKAAGEMVSSIEAMSANGLTPQEISLLTGIKPERLYRRYREAMMKGGARRKHDVAESAYYLAVGGPEKNWRQADASIVKFWLERHGGAAWSAPSKDGGDGPDLTRLSVSQLIELERALRPLARNAVLIDGHSEGSGGAIEVAAGSGGPSEGPEGTE